MTTTLTLPPDGVFNFTTITNQVATVTDPLTHTTSFGYDPVGNLTSVTDPLSQHTTLSITRRGSP